MRVLGELTIDLALNPAQLGLRLRQPDAGFEQANHQHEARAALSHGKVEFHRQPDLCWMVAVGNHPGHYADDDAVLTIEIERLANDGRIGLEAHYARSSPPERTQLRNLADDRRPRKVRPRIGDMSYTRK